MNDRFCSLDLLEDTGKGFEPFWDNWWLSEPFRAKNSTHFSGKKLNNATFNIGWRIRSQRKNSNSESKSLIP